MNIYIDTDTLEPMFLTDQLMMISEFKDVYRQFGFQGIHYVVLHGWKGSPYSLYHIDETERDSIVVDDIKSRDTYDPIKQLWIEGKKWTHKEAHKLPAMVKATKKLNFVAKVELFELKEFYQLQLTRLQNSLTGLDFNTDDDIKLRKNSLTQKELIGNLSLMRAEIEKLDEKIHAKMKSTQEASLNDFLNI